MIVVLVHNAQAEQLQLSMEPVDPALAIKLLRQAIALIQQQTGVITPASTTSDPAGQPPSPPPPRRRNIRELIVPHELNVPKAKPQ